MRCYQRRHVRYRPGCGTALLADGARVYILGRSKERGAQALRYLEKQTGKQAVYISCDVTKQAECKAAVAKIAEQEGKPDWQLDILVNSATFIASSA